MQSSFLTGHTISLRIPEADDVFVRGWSAWYNNQDLTRHNTHGRFPITQEQEWEIIKNEMLKPDSLLLAIYENETERLIGNICLQEIDLIDRNTRLAIMVGESSTPTAFVEAFGLMTHHALMKLNLNHVFDATHENLLNLVQMLGVFGYEVEGLAKEHFFSNGKYSDRIHFGTTRNRFLAKLESRSGKLLFENKDELLGAVRRELKKNPISNLKQKIEHLDL